MAPPILLAPAKGEVPPTLSVPVVALPLVVPPAEEVMLVLDAPPTVVVPALADEPPVVALVVPPL